MLDGDSDRADDVADSVKDRDGKTRRQRVWDKEAVPKHLRIIRTIGMSDRAATNDEEEIQPQFWHWCDRPLEGGRSSNKLVLWELHVSDVVKDAKEILGRLHLPANISEAIIVAAKLHDHGKKRAQFQLALGNQRYPAQTWAKSGPRHTGLIAESFRHEFASVLDAQINAEFGRLDPEMQDLVLHLIAAHHGRARPHFAFNEAFDPERPSSDAESLASETPRRFARLQRRYGRWGVAYLESILRAADWAASAAESDTAP
jgi:CRISPR-associated endonuclease/helicase Cas3